MTVQVLDFYFPFFVLFYGFMITIVTTMDRFVRLSETRLPSGMHKQLSAHRGLGVLCLLLGAAWSLQNIWYSSL